MTDPTDDDDPIAAWAQGLTPEGAPGEMATMMRKVLGDEGYEQALAQHNALSELHINRQHLINKILTLVVVYGVVIMVTFSVALVIFCVRNFS